MPLGSRSSSIDAPARRHRLLVAIAGAVLLLAGCKTELLPGERLNAGDSLLNGHHRLTMDTNGILNMYGPASIVWRSHGSTASGVYAVMQSDGNFVVRNGSTVFFDTGTHGNPGAYLELDRLGRLIVWNASGTQLLWMGSPVIAGFNSPTQNRTLANGMLDEFYPEWSEGGQKTCLGSLWQAESGWDHTAVNPSSGACGIPQSLPCDKMAGWGFAYLVDHRVNPYPQVMWGLEYIDGRYGSPCSAWAFWQANGWY